MKRRAFTILATLLAVALALGQSNSGVMAQDDVPAPQEDREITRVVALGDTWSALAWRYSSTPTELLNASATINPHRQPAIGSEIVLPESASRNGRYSRPLAGGSLAIAAANGQNPWTLALQNDLRHPYSPLLYTPLVLPAGSRPPRELPAGLDQLALSPGQIYPGSALALRTRTSGETVPDFALEHEPLIVTRDGQEVLALGATGAFLPPGQYLLTVRAAGSPLWEQPLLIADRDWTWEQVTFNNTAVLDPEEIRRERERLQTLWDEATPAAHWQGGFTSPIADFVEISSQYGARRSVNGGPYASYHEGTDFSAYGGSEVRAPAAGKVVLAEELVIRGGAVILDHGLGLHSGYYHLSAVHVQPGQEVAAGDLLGEVGSTGRSTGNHLHWDLLVGRTWIDPLIWLDQGLDTWLSPAPLPSYNPPGLAQ